MPRTNNNKVAEIPSTMDLMAYEFLKGINKSMNKCLKSGLDSIEAEMCLREAFRVVVKRLEYSEDRKDL